MAAAVAVVAAAGLAGCTSTPPQTSSVSQKYAVSSPPPATISTAPVDPRTITFPVDAYRATPQQELAVQNAAQILMARCVKGFGLTLPVQLRTVPASVRDYARVYGLVDAADAARYGYQAPPTPTPTKSRGNHGEGQSADAADLATVLSGWPGGKVGDLAHPPAGVSVRGKAVPTGGCAAQAAQSLGLADNENPGETDLVRSIADGASHQAEADARVTAAFAEWSKCMKDKGFSYSTPWDPVDRTWPKPVGADEISTATADVACKRQVNLVATWYAVEVAYENALIQRNLNALTEEKAHNDGLAAKASQVLSEGVG